MLRSRRTRSTVALMLLLPQLAGCFQYVPATTEAVPTGSRISFGVTDPGRVALSDAVGPGVQRIEGRLVATTDTSLVLSVLAIEHVDLRVPLKWRGEQVAVPRNYVTDVREWRLSKGRSWLLAGLIAVGAVVAAQLAITGFGSDGGNDKPGPGDPGQTSVVPGIQR
jgi:hypothetical protein